MDAQRNHALTLGLLALILGNVTDGWISAAWLALSLVVTGGYFAMVWLDRRN